MLLAAKKVSCRWSLDAGDSGGSLLVALADHDSVGGQHLGLLAADVEGNGVDETLRVDLVVVDCSAIPDLMWTLLNFSIFVGDGGAK